MICPLEFLIRCPLLQLAADVLWPIIYNDFLYRKLVMDLDVSSVLSSQAVIGTIFIGPCFDCKMASYIT